MARPGLVPAGVLLALLFLLGITVLLLLRAYSCMRAAACGLVDACCGVRRGYYQHSGPVGPRRSHSVRGLLAPVEFRCRSVSLFVR